MNINILQELKPYSIKDLQTTFGVDIKILDNILKKLSSMNIVKKISSDTSDDKLEELLEVESIENLDFKIEGSMYIFKYVGMLEIANTCLLIYPKYIKNYKEDSKNNYKLFRQILAVIRKYNSKEQKHGFLDSNNTDNFNLLAIALEFIRIYHENGLYSNEQQIIEVNGDGEILWEKTINETTAYFSNNIPFYLDLYTINQENDNFDYFRRLNMSILTEICSKTKDLLIILGIEPINISSDSIDNFGDLDFVIYKINQELSSQFVTIKQSILKLMKQYLLHKNNENNPDYISFIGTTSFNLIWEDVCSVVMDDCMDKSIRELNLKYSKISKRSALISDIVEKPKWVHYNTTASHESKRTLIPDIISIKDDKLYIYDAKYYNIILNEEHVKKQPSVGDITKQYLYELAYKEFAEENNLKIVKNAFLMPTDNDDDIILGCAHMDMFSKLKEINAKEIEVILKSAHKMYNIYLNN